MMQVDFQYDAEEGSLRMSLWKLVNPVYRFLTAGGMAPEEIMYCGRSLNMAGIHQWNAIFLLPAGVFFEDSMWKTFCNAYRAYPTARCMDIPV
jgi:hypothetical protein